MQDQGNADVHATPAHEAVAAQTRPEWVTIARNAVDAVRGGDLEAIQQAKHDSPESPYSAAEVCIALGVSKSTIYKAIESGALTAMRFGNTRKGTIRIPHSAFIDYVTDCMAAAVTRPGTHTRQRSIRVEVA